MTATAFDSFETYKARKRFLNLDGIRFLCISAVIWHHAGIELPFLTQLFSRGFLGVDFFFVLSGFLITTLLLRERERKGRVSFRGFYWRRFLRIIPVYFFVVTAVTAYYGIVQGQAEALERAPYYYLFLSNFMQGDTPLLAPTWSLSVEEQYYVLWPLLLVLIPARWIVPFLLAMIAVNVLIIMGAFDFIAEEPYQRGLFILTLPNATYAPILMGSLAAILLNRKGAYEVLGRFLGQRWMALALGLALLVMFQVTPADLRGLPNLAIHLTMTAMLISLLVREENLLKPFLNFAPVVRVGEISYGMYLYHLIGLHIATVGMKLAGFESKWLGLIGMFAITWVISEVSYRTLEAAFRSLRAKPPFFIAPSTKVQPSS
ncbi:acyltransferase family protein [Parvularcula lutaonensis]|uniref:Acyltransferase family protein n=1 Tax=Parvularcula lutaonensis TaxID=491923 RepID=A0ABV7MB23_9PROT|nr:acyltransferase [Parvularcula lutaonensis]GGY39351.1 acyltransferase [Parvularcula lutaonensis]